MVLVLLAGCTAAGDSSALAESPLAKATDWESVEDRLTELEEDLAELDISEEYPQSGDNLEEEENREQREAELETSEVQLRIFDFLSMSAPSKALSIIAEGGADAGVIWGAEEFYGGREIIVVNRNQSKTPWG